MPAKKTVKKKSKIRKAATKPTKTAKKVTAKITKITSPSILERLRNKIISEPKRQLRYVAISGGTCGKAKQSDKVVEAFQAELKKQRLDKKVKIRVTGCHGFCEREPIVVIEPEGICYLQVKPTDVPEIVSKTLIDNTIIDRLLYKLPQEEKRIKTVGEIPFYKNQLRLLLSSNVKLDPRNIDDYIAIGGYSALAKALFKMTPEQIIEEVKKSGLRGRGGAGFPTGKKWEVCKNVPGDTKYVIVNCDEGDPGAYMDRSLLEGNPHSVIEGFLIGAYAIGANEGYIYVREEYPLAVENVNIAIEQARKYGLLGKNILGSKFNFDIKVHRGAGAFVCGEETALIASLEGRVGIPRQRPPFPAISGLYGKPTVINNVETWANIPLIINNGSRWFASYGTETSKGTKIFALVGKVNNTGLVEVPMGITLRKIIYDIGGGIPGGKKFKAVQTGGPSGGCIPEAYLDTPVDYEALTNLGSIMGSGGMIVMDEDTCMVDTTKFFLNFLRSESCGNCLSCREGLQKLYEIVDDITNGKGKEEDLETLQDLAETVKDTSLCGLGQTATNPLLSTLRFFRDEYIAHIKDKRCPAKVCKTLITLGVDPQKCTLCGACIKICPYGAMVGEPKKDIPIIDQSKCTKCKACYDVCKSGAIYIK